MKQKNTEWRRRKQFAQNEDNPSRPRANCQGAPPDAAWARASECTARQRNRPIAERKPPSLRGEVLAVVQAKGEHRCRSINDITAPSWKYLNLSEIENRLEPSNRREAIT